MGSYHSIFWCLTVDDNVDDNAVVVDDDENDDDGDLWEKLLLVCDSV